MHGLAKDSQSMDTATSKFLPVFLCFCIEGRLILPVRDAVGDSPTGSLLVHNMKTAFRYRIPDSWSHYNEPDRGFQVGYFFQKVSCVWLLHAKHQRFTLRFLLLHVIKLGKYVYKLFFAAR